MIILPSEEMATKKDPPSLEQAFRVEPKIVHGMVWLTRVQFDALPTLNRPPPVRSGARWKTARNRVVADRAPGRKHDGRLLDPVAGAAITEEERAERATDGGQDWYMGKYTADGTRIEWLPIIVGE